MAEEIRLARLQGKILVENEKGYFEFKDKDDGGVRLDLYFRKLTKEEIIVYHPDENNIARPCPTGEYRYVRTKGP